MLTVRIPEAYFPRYEIWSPDYMLSGQEDPWFATNYLGSVLTRDALTRKRIKRLSSLQAEMLKDEEVVSSWWDLVATRFDDVAFSLLGVRAMESATKEDRIGFITAFFPDAKQG